MKLFHFNDRSIMANIFKYYYLHKSYAGHDPVTVFYRNINVNDHIEHRENAVFMQIVILFLIIAKTYTCAL